MEAEPGVLMAHKRGRGEGPAASALPTYPVLRAATPPATPRKTPRKGARTPARTPSGSASKPRGPFGSPLTPHRSDPAVARIYSVIKATTGSLGGNGEGGPIYGELTQASMQRVIDVLK
ncbi:hypothetical protein JKP88DRAFT_249384, partial [Tribonema minus]